MSTGFTIKEPVVGVAGDWHGTTWHALRAIESFHNAGIKNVFHLGDFGFWGGQDSAKYIRKVIHRLERFDMHIYVTLGNHEDYWRVDRKPANEDGTRFYESERLVVLPRPFKGYIGGKSFMSLGGANSIDFKMRKEGVSWWREESITVTDVENAAKMGHVDIMFCHEVPDGVNLQSFRKNWRGGWNTDEVFYSEAGRKTLRLAVDEVKPSILFHGHHHLFQDSTTTLEDYKNNKYVLRTVGLAKDGEANNIAAFNAESSTYEVLPVEGV